MRYRSIDSLIEEIHQTVKRHNLDTIMFIDSTFNLNKKWMLRFLKRYKEKIKVSFSMNVRADLIDEDIVKAIAETRKCASVRFAIETGSERLRNEILKKSLTNKQIINSVRLFKKYKLKVLTFNMFGIPTETLENAYETVKMNQKVNPTVISCSVFLPFVGLHLTDYVIRNGLMNKSDFKKLGVSPYRMHRSVLKQKDIGKVTNLHKFLIIAVRFPFLFPLIKQLIKLPPNKIYDWIYNISQGTEWMKWMRMNPIRFVKESLKNYKKVS